MERFVEGSCLVEVVNTYLTRQFVNRSSFLPVKIWNERIPKNFKNKTARVGQGKWEHHHNLNFYEPFDKAVFLFASPFFEICSSRKRSNASVSSFFPRKEKYTTGFEPVMSNIYSSKLMRLMRSTTPPCIQKKEKPPFGIEPKTVGLQNQCSTTELRKRKNWDFNCWRVFFI